MAERRVSFIIGANIQNLRKGLDNAEKRMSQFGKNMNRIGRDLSFKITAPILALGTVATQSWEKQALAIAQVEAGLKSTGNQVGFTSKELQKMASDLQKNTLFGDEEILKGATSQLLTFTNITGEQFTRTQEAALDLATRLDGDLKSASIQLGKALNDPVANLSALSRSGIQFSKDQKEVIKSLAESGRLMDAQNIILTELEKQYGGSAEAAADASNGVLQLKNALGDVAEQFGKIISQFLKPLSERLIKVTEDFKNLSEESKKRILAVSLVIASIPPLILAIGAAAKVASIGMGILSAITNSTFIAVLAAIAATVAGLSLFAIGIKSLMDNSKAFKERFHQLWVRIKNNLIDILDSMLVAMIKILDPFNTGMFNGLIGSLQQFKSEIPEVTTEFVNVIDSAKSLGEKVGGVFKEITNDIQAMTAALFGYDSAQENIQNKYSGNTHRDKLDSKGVRQLDLSKASVELTKAGDSVESFKQKGIGLSSALQNSISSSVISFASTIGNAFTGDAGAKGFFQGILTIVADFAIQLGKAITAMGVAAESLKKLFANPIAAIAAGTALIIAGTVAKNLVSDGIPALAEGGLAFGNTLAMVGDNPNARVDPEVIAPLSKLKDMMGNDGAVIHNVIKLNDRVLFEGMAEAERKGR